METKTKWIADPAHSELQFKVKHLMITNVKGEFRKFEADVETPGNDFSKASIHVKIHASSLFTNSDERDFHLKSVDFFDVEKYPLLIFEGTSIKKMNDENYALHGLLTIKDVSKEVKLEVEVGGIMKDPWGNEKAGFSITGSINRKDWGLNWNAALEAGGVLVGDEVKLSAEVQFIKQV